MSFVPFTGDARRLADACADKLVVEILDDDTETSARRNKQMEELQSRWDALAKDQYEDMVVVRAHLKDLQKLNVKTALWLRKLPDAKYFNEFRFALSEFACKCTIEVSWYENELERDDSDLKDVVKRIIKTQDDVLQGQRSCGDQIIEEHA